MVTFIPTPTQTKIIPPAKATQAKATQPAKATQTKAAIGIIHGLGEHIERYDELANYLNERNISVLGYDRRGHGQSEGKRGHTPSYQAFLDEIKGLVKQMKQRYPNVPSILYGHSMGGNLLLHFLIQNNNVVDAAIVSAPWIALSFQPSPIKVIGGKLIRKILPSLSIKNELDTKHLSRDMAEVKKYEEDPLVHDRITPNTGSFMLDAAEELNVFSGDWPTPSLLMHGTDDGVLSHDATKAFAERITGDVQFKSWEGGYHELHKDSNKEEVMDYVGKWLAKVLKNV